MRAVIYARCSTDEKRQDVEVQLVELRRYCKAYAWEYEEVSEYDSGFKGEQPKLQKALEGVRRKRYDVFLVYSLDRFSRNAPSKVNRLLDAIVERDGCRFISRQEGIDSENELVWHAIRPLFTYFANVYSRNLSDKIRKGIANKRLNGQYRGGRPCKNLDLARLREIIGSGGEGLGWRPLTKAYNEERPCREQASVTLIRRVCQKHSLKLPVPVGSRKFTIKPDQ